MYDIRTLNIWKDKGVEEIFGCGERILEAGVSDWRESVMSKKCQLIFNEIMQLVPTANFAEIKRRRGGKFRFPIYMNEKLNETDLEVLELSHRSSNCLHRAGFQTVGELVERIEGIDDLMRIRNCGMKSVNEIMEQLFCYQYSLIPAERKVKYINRVLQLNSK